MGKKKYIIILIFLVLTVLCAVGASTWIITSPVSQKPDWNEYSQTRIHVSDIELNYSDDINNSNFVTKLLGTVETDIINDRGESIKVATFLDESNLPVTLKKGVDYTNIQISMVGDDYRDGTKIIGSTYLANVIVTIGASLNSQYELDPNYLADNSTNRFTPIVKYKTVQANGTWYTIEDALKVTSSGTATVRANTSFASKIKNGDQQSVAERAGYITNEDKTSCYTVESGATLLVPYDDKDSGNILDFNTANSSSAVTKAGGFVKFQATADFAVKGKLIVNALVNITTGAYTASVAGKNYGQMDVAKDVKVTIASGGRFESIGFTTGEGLVEAEDGSTVYELFNIVGWRGGSISTHMVQSSTPFPFNQYSLACIECKISIKAGSHYKMYTCMNMNSKNYDSELSFISTANTSFLKLSGTSHIEKWIESSGENIGKIHFAAYGTVTFNNITMTLLGNTVGTSGRQVPIPGNLVISLEKDSNVEIPSGVSLKLLPGALLHVKSGSTLKISGNAYAYGSTPITYTQSQSHWVDGNIPYPRAELKNVYRLAVTDKTLGYSANASSTEMTPAQILVGGLVVANSGTLAGSISGEEGGIVQTGSSVARSGKITEYLSPKTTTILGKTVTTGINTYDATIQSYTINGDGSTQELVTGAWQYLNGNWNNSVKTTEVKYTVYYHYRNNDNTKDNSETYSAYLIGDETEYKVTSLPVSDPTWKYHTFIDWYTDDGMTIDIDHPWIITPSGDNIIHVYAEWKLTEYRIMYNITGYGTESFTIASEEIWRLGDNITIHLITVDELIEKGYLTGDINFKGWYRVYYGGEYSEPISYMNDDTANLELAIQDAYIVVFGYYYINSYNVIYDVTSGIPAEGYGSNGKELPTDQTISLGGTLGEQLLDGADYGLTLHDYDIDKPYYFDGWYANNYKVESDTEISTKHLSADGTLKLVARWADKATITINLTDNFSSTDGCDGRLHYAITIQNANQKKGDVENDKSITLIVYLFGEQLKNWEVKIIANGGNKPLAITTPRSNGTYTYSNSQNGSLELGKTYIINFTIEIGSGPTNSYKKNGAYTNSGDWTPSIDKNNYSWP